MVRMPVRIVLDGRCKLYEYNHMSVVDVCIKTLSRLGLTVQYVLQCYWVCSK